MTIITGVALNSQISVYKTHACNDRQLNNYLREVMFLPLYLLVCQFSTGLLKNYGNDFHNTWWQDGTLPSLFFFLDCKIDILTKFQGS